MNHCFQAKEKQIKDNQCSKLGLCIAPLPFCLLVSPGNLPWWSSRPGHLEYWCQLPPEVLNGAPTMMEGLGSEIVKFKNLGLPHCLKQSERHRGLWTAFKWQEISDSTKKWLHGNKLLKMAKMVNFLLCISYHNKRKMYVLNKLKEAFPNREGRSTLGCVAFRH